MTRRNRIDAALSEISTGKPIPVVSAAPHPIPLNLLPCIHLGERIPNQPCGSQLYTCNKYKTTTTRFVKCTSAERHCETCPDREIVVPSRPVAYQPVTTRHLLYHIYPIAGNGSWQRNVANLVERMGLFNGKRVVAIVTDPPTGRISEARASHAPDGYRQFGACDSPDTVKQAFGSLANSIEFLNFTNDPNKREVLTFQPLFERAISDDPTHATFYGQAKGVTRPANSTTHDWSDALYTLHLDYWPLVDEILRTHPVAGAFLKIGMGWPAEQSLSQWHYSGSFLWFRNAALFSRNWQKIDNFWGAQESYPSVHFSRQEAGCIFHAAPVPHMNLYNRQYWKGTVVPLLERFHAINAPRRLHCPPLGSRKLNFGCGPWKADGWINTDVITTDVIQPDILTPLGKRLPFPDAHFTHIYAGHVLEHVPWDRLPEVLAEFKRVLQPHGELRIVGPDYVRVLNAWKAGKATWDDVIGIVEDANHHQRESLDHEWDAARHHWNSEPGRIIAALKAAGFASAREEEFVPANFAGWPVVDFSNQNQCAVSAF